MFIDLNADMGESYGSWRIGNDAALLSIVSSANVACGFHAGDPDVMMKTMTLAKNNSVGIGAHPGFADLQGFGRRRLQISMNTLQNQIRYQIGAAHAIAAAARGAPAPRTRRRALTRRKRRRTTFSPPSS